MLDTISVNYQTINNMHLPLRAISEVVARKLMHGVRKLC